MVRLVRLAALALLPAVSLAQLQTLEKLQAAGQGALRGVLTKVFGMNETQLDRAFQKEPPIVPHPYAVDITDDNFERVLKTGSVDNPLAPKLPDDTVWVIAVYAVDQFSKLFMQGFNDVASFNSSASGGSLPENMIFGRLNYGTETVLPTKLWLWKVPVLVIAKNDFKELRFFKLGQVSPFHGLMAGLLNDENLWQTMPVWHGSIAPGGSLEPFIEKLGRGWAFFHAYLSKIPNFIILMFSGMTMNFVVGFFHKKPAVPSVDASQKKLTEAESSGTAPAAGSSTATKKATTATKRK